MLGLILAPPASFVLRTIAESWQLQTKNEKGRNWILQMIWEKDEIAEFEEQGLGESGLILL